MNAASFKRKAAGWNRRTISARTAIHGLTFHNSRFEQAISLHAFVAITHSAWRDGHPWPAFFHNSRFEQAVSLRAFVAITHSAWRDGHPWPDFFPQQPLRAGRLVARIRSDHAFRVAERPPVA